MKYATLFLALSLGACQSLTAPKSFIPEGAVEITQLPPEFAQVWAQVDACTGHPRPMSVHFYSVPGAGDRVRFYNRDGQLVYGLYEWRSDRIFVAQGTLHADWSTLRHEMVHAHLPESTAGTHPDEYFSPTSKCGKLGL